MEDVEKTPVEKVAHSLNALESANHLPTMIKEDYATQVGSVIINVLEDYPECAQQLYKVKDKPSRPLLHWICDLGCHLVVVKVVYEAYPEGIKLKEDNGDLPLHVACRNEQTVAEVIEFLLQCFPESLQEKDCLGNLPCQAVFWNSPNRQQLFMKMTESMNLEETKKVTLRGSTNWEYPSPFPLDLIHMVIDLHECKSLVVIGQVGDVESTVVKVQVDEEQNSDAVIVELHCDRFFAYAVELLLTLPIPIKAIETRTMDDQYAVKFLAATLKTSQPQEEDDYQTQTRHMEVIGLPADILGAPAPLDLSQIERVSVDSIISDSKTMVNLLKGFAALPNLVKLVLDDKWASYEGCVSPLYEDCFRGLSTLDRLQELQVLYYPPLAIPAIAELIRNTQALKKITILSFIAMAADDIQEIAQALAKNTSVKTLRLGKLSCGTEHLLNVLRHDNETLENFVGEGTYHHADDIQHCCFMNCLKPMLSGSDITLEDAIDVYTPHVDDLSVLYDLLRFRPELWSEG